MKFSHRERRGGHFLHLGSVRRPSTLTGGGIRYHSRWEGQPVYVYNGLLMDTNYPDRIMCMCYGLVELNSTYGALVSVIDQSMAGSDFFFHLTCPLQLRAGPTLSE